MGEGLPNARKVTGRDWIALAATLVLIAALIGSVAWMQARARAQREARARAAAAAALEAAPKPAPPITTSVYIRPHPIRHAQ